jgi:hypothetical protein
MTIDRLDKFNVWVELEEYDVTKERNDEDGYCNVIVQYSNGLKIGLNVWSEKYFYTQVNDFEWIDSQVAILPDLVVRNFDASSIRQAVTNLIIKDNWLEGRGFPAI